MLPTEIRSTGHAAANAMSRVGGFFAPFLVSSEDSRVVGFTMLIVSIFGTAAVLRLPETKGRAMGVAVGDDAGRDDQVAILSAAAAADGINSSAESKAHATTELSVVSGDEHEIL